MENSTQEADFFSLETAGNDQLQSVSKWSRFIGVVFIIFGAVLAISIILLLANFEILMTQIMKLNGIDEDTISMLERGGKYFIAFALTLSSIILFVNGFLLYRFGKLASIFHTKENINILAESFGYLKQYIYFSFILASISAVLSLISTFVFFGGGH